MFCPYINEKGDEFFKKFFLPKTELEYNDELKLWERKRFGSIMVKNTLKINDL